MTTEEKRIDLEEKTAKLNEAKAASPVNQITVDAAQAEVDKATKAI